MKQLQQCLRQLAGERSPRGPVPYSLGLGAVLQVAHPADGLRLLAGVTVASMDHLGVSLLSTAVFGVLVS